MLIENWDPRKDIDFADEDGYTALHFAALIGYPRIASLLLEKGANPLKRTRMGISCWRLVLELDNPSVQSAMATILEPYFEAHLKLEREEAKTKAEARERTEVSDKSKKKGKTKTKREKKLQRQVKAMKNSRSSQAKEKKQSAKTQLQNDYQSTPPLRHKGHQEAGGDDLKEDRNKISKNHKPKKQQKAKAKSQSKSAAPTKRENQRSGDKKE